MQKALFQYLVFIGFEYWFAISQSALFQVQFFAA